MGINIILIPHLQRRDYLQGSNSIERTNEMLRNPEASHRGKGQREGMESPVSGEDSDWGRESPRRSQSLEELQLLPDHRCPNRGA